MKATIRSANLIQTTAFSKISNNTTNPDSLADATTTMSQLLTDCLAREENLAAELEQKNSQLPASPKIEYYASIYTENVRLRTLLSSSKSLEKKLKTQTGELRHKVQTSASDVLQLQKLTESNVELQKRLDKEMDFRKKLQDDVKVGKNDYEIKLIRVEGRLNEVKKALEIETREKQKQQKKYQMYVKKIVKGFERIKARNEFLERLGNNHLGLGLLKSMNTSTDGGSITSGKESVGSGGSF
ncbi:hypothetical protein TL16_g07408 [Triparma laevis f. inornata]|uniref:Uncharacterized protein n=1 Tax=Triparma laevis f. inornata TaxID=1714386 RepID=A0A9W7B0R7_9STRA|nr:hypothetical protein TL16_g07408 [Triparma laevis f. inornata]